MQARWATSDDLDELLRLREVMLAEMGRGGRADEWRDRVAGQLAGGLPDGTFFAAVVDAPGGAGLAGAGIATVHHRLAGPGDDGRIGYVQSMATDPRWRRRGVARAVVELLLAELAARGVGRCALHASAAGEPLYRSVGFTEPRWPELRWYGDVPGGAGR